MSLALPQLVRRGYRWAPCRSPRLQAFEHLFIDELFRGTNTVDRLRAGDIAPRNALAVLELAGFPADVLEDARRLAAS